MIKKQEAISKYEEIKSRAESIYLNWDGRLIFMKHTYLCFHELIGFRKVIRDGELIFVQKKQNSMVEINPIQIMYYACYFLDHIGRSDIGNFLVDKNIFFSPKLLNMFIEEAPFEFFDEVIEFYSENGVEYIAKDRMFPDTI